MAKKKAAEQTLFGVIIAIIVGVIMVFASLLAPEGQRPVAAPATTRQESIPVTTGNQSGASSTSSQDVLQPAGTLKPGQIP